MAEEVLEENCGISQEAILQLMNHIKNDLKNIDVKEKHIKVKDTVPGVEYPVEIKQIQPYIAYYHQYDNYFSGGEWDTPTNIKIVFSNGKYYYLPNNKNYFFISTEKDGLKAIENSKQVDISYIWTINDNIYYSNDTIQYKLNTETNKWDNYTWGGLSSFKGDHIWTDGEDIYYSENDDKQYKLNKNTNEWEKYIWNVEFMPGSNEDPIHYNFWTDGEEIYYTYDNNEYKLNRKTNTWGEYPWNVYINDSSKLWKDGENFYYTPTYGEQYKLNKSTNEWEDCRWGNDYNIDYGENIWVDGENIYYSCWSNQYKLNKTTNEWEDCSWNKSINYGENIWSDGENIYYSYYSNQYKLNKTTNEWEDCSWNKSINYGKDIWSDGENIYYSDQYDNQYKLNKTTNEWENYIWEGLYSFEASNVLALNEDIYIISKDCKTVYKLNKSINKWEICIEKKNCNNGKYIWADGENIYYSNKEDQYKLNKEASEWDRVSWNKTISGEDIWSDGENIYYSYDDNYSSSIQYKLNKDTNEWEDYNNWNKRISGKCIQLDGENIYHFNNNYQQYKLNKETNEWENYSLYYSGSQIIDPLDSKYIWAYYDNDGKPKIFYSEGTRQYRLNQYYCWERYSWSSDWIPGSGKYIWSDGENIYYSYNRDQYRLNKEATAWEAVTWNKDIENGDFIWSDGEDIYYSGYNSSYQYKLNKDTNEWENISWINTPYREGNCIWSDGENIYNTWDDEDYYVLDKENKKWIRRYWAQPTGFLYVYGYNVWSDGENIYYSDNNNHFIFYKGLNKWKQINWNINSFNTPFQLGNDCLIPCTEPFCYQLNFILNKINKTWNIYGDSVFSKSNWGNYYSKENVWSDGEYYYFNQYRFNKKINAFYSFPIDMPSGEYTPPSGFWTDSINIFCSNGSFHYILNKEKNKWENYSWNGDFKPEDGNYIWSFNKNIYYSNSNDQYKLNKETNTWEIITWEGYVPNSGKCIWSDGKNIYYSKDSDQYKLNRKTNKWVKISWNIDNIDGYYIWTDTKNIYYSKEGSTYILRDNLWKKIECVPAQLSGDCIWLVDNKNIYTTNIGILTIEGGE